ncbi:MAG: hypothetical protein JJ896_09230 [Rhodothermales bacterium]|nr:hypothetical protein [Rhodothermales bacterium]MBO6779819.1 hypothetical protein [Rhodothermales bacterium]
MSHTLAFEKHGLGCVVTLSGSLTAADLFAANLSLYEADPDGRLRYQIWDLTRANSLTVSASDLHELAAQDGEASEEAPGQLVAICGPTGVLRGANELYSMYADEMTDFKTETFSSVSRARLWVERNLGRMAA